MGSPSIGTAEPSASRLRAVARLALLAVWLVLCLVPHLVAKTVAGRSRWPRRFLAGCARIAGASVRVRGDPVRAHSLLLCNHISWLDILVAADATGARFVAKEELGHGFLGWLSDQNGTLYVKRSDRRGSKNQAQAIAAALDSDQPVALFPEGTVGPGDELLPFRSTLLEAAAYAGKDVVIRPVAIDYGAAATEISWHAENGFDNVLRVFGRRGTIPVTVHLMPPLDAGQDRKALARQSRDAIAVALSASSSAAPRL